MGRRVKVAETEYRRDVSYKEMRNKPSGEAIVMTQSPVTTITPTDIRTPVLLAMLHVVPLLKHTTPYYLCRVGRYGRSYG